MKTAAIVLLISAGLSGCATTGSVPGTASQPRVYGYTLSGEQVVFAFRPADYESVTSGSTGEWLPMSELRINRVAVAGEFNRWSTDAWQMARTGGSWVASKPIAEFEAARPLQFKFVVNGRFWAEPPDGASNRMAVPEQKVTNLLLQINDPHWQPIMNPKVR